MRARTLTGAPATLAITITLAAATPAASHPLVGSWLGEWQNRNRTELTITRVEADRAYGSYCHAIPSRHAFGVLELHPDHGITATVEGAILNFKLSNAEFNATLDGTDPDIVVLTDRRGKKSSVLNLARQDAPTCTRRYLSDTMPEIAGNGPSVASLIPVEPEDWRIGHWAGGDPDQLWIELTVTGVEDRHVVGLYCNVWSSGAMYFFDVHPDALRARATRNGLKFRIRDIQFAFKRTDDDTMRITRRREGRKTTLDIHRTTEPLCAPHVIPLHRR